ncbi:DUF4037 domain-containing protein [Kineococcus sp. NUM-3379]
MGTGGVDLARAYWSEVVAPLLARRWPALPHAAARLGTGSDVLGLDDAVSRDHDWGLRLTLLVPAAVVTEVGDVLESELPATFRGLPTRFPLTRDQRVVHRVDVTTVGEFAGRHLGLGPDGPAGVLEWLSLTGQSVLEVTAGAVFRDTEGRLTRLRERLTWYPHDLWCYAVACDWQRIDQELPFVGRTGDVGDDLGSRLVTARLVRVAMHLGFLLQRRWAPYPKWFGTCFARTPVGVALQPVLAAALTAGTWRTREEALCRALEALLRLQREAGLPAPASATRPFFERPYRSVAPEVTSLLRSGIEDPAARALPAGVGTVEQWIDNVDALVDPGRRAAALAAWRPLLPTAGPA